MRSYDANTAAYLAGETAIVSHVLIWIAAKNRSTGATESIGFWSGDDHQDFTINGQTRTYYGAGDVLDVPPITYEAGLTVRMHTFGLASLAPEVAMLLRGYEPRLAPVEVHRVLFYSSTGAQAADPHRVLAGWIDEAQIDTPAIGGTGGATITVASSARGLTRTLPICKSDAQLQLRSGDRFRRYADVSGAVDVFWGSKRGRVGGGGSGPSVTPGGGGGGGWRPRDGDDRGGRD